MIPKDPLLPEFFNIDNIRQESKNVFSLRLSQPNAKSFAFKPGQFNMLYAFGIGESAISFSGDPNKTNHITHTIKAVGQVTQHLSLLKANQQIGLRGPFGTPWPIEICKKKSILLIAGGIGIAPLRSVIYQLLSSISNYSDITLIYGDRFPQDILYQEELNAWKKKFNVRITVDHASADWSENTGVVTSLIPKVVHAPDNTIVMMCGPEIMMHSCIAELTKLTVPINNIYLSMERNMQCGFGQCGLCQWGPYFICKDGPVMNFAEIEPFFYKKAL